MIYEDIVARARELRAVIEIAAQSLNDETALENVELFPLWDGHGIEYEAGMKVRYDGELYRVLQNHTSQLMWMPTEAYSLFAKVLAGQEGTDIGEWEQPDSTNPYNTGDRVTFEGHTYESLIDGNVWSPSAYPAGWKQLD